MKKLSQQLSQFISDRPISEEDKLSVDEKRIFRSLKAMGERAIKGREIRNCLFEVRFQGETATLRMVMEGRHSMSVGKQVARRFSDNGELKFVDVVRTKRGAKVVLCPICGETK